ncbi:hypothetical protein ACFFX1_26595 [Dactylosporangium sucinum]|uniref:Uncharacterized protein n=1 Tax=Dactylosporangium sucinum TaxID=1424081 RepID=A0A917T154_9ACTN|nr:hypothetical protein [Dactylosporangium sucinum]GGM05568.1 hypothetical protein GCM10007977_003370 [Dactylosporangium sucinum]
MDGRSLGIVMLRAALGTSLGAAPFISSALRFALMVGLGSTGTALQAVAAAYFAFCVMAVTAAAFIAACVVAVIMAMATPAFPAVKSAAEAVVSAIAMVAGAAGKVLTGIAAGGTAILMAGFGLKMFVGSEPGGVKGADFQQIKIDYSPLGSGDYVAPKKELPAPAGP